VGFGIATFAAVYFGAVVYAETVGATIDQLGPSNEGVDRDEF
jgi:hypothetical protein